MCGAEGGEEGDKSVGVGVGEGGEVDGASDVVEGPGGIDKEKRGQLGSAEAEGLEEGEGGGEEAGEGEEGVGGDVGELDGGRERDHYDELVASGALDLADLEVREGEEEKERRSWR